MKGVLMEHSTGIKRKHLCPLFARHQYQITMLPLCAYVQYTYAEYTQSICSSSANRTSGDTIFSYLFTGRTRLTEPQVLALAPAPPSCHHLTCYRASNNY